MPSPADRSPGFPQTAWTVIQDAQSLDEVERRRALERLISVYWRPIYWTIRLDWNQSAEEAQDLTQDYFTSFLSRELVTQVERERGNFRFFAKATLKNFMLNRKREAGALKRGGDRRLEALDDVERVERESQAREDPPEVRFERELMRSLVARALDALREECLADDKEREFELFRTFYYEESAGRKVRYEELQERFSMDHHEVKNRLAELRARFKKNVLQLLRDGVSTEEELEREIREVFQA